MANENKKENKKVAYRGKVMELVKRKKKTLKSAAYELRISYRQAKRIYRKYVDGGDAALVHGNTGKRSNHRTDGGTVKEAVKSYEEKYDDFGPTLAREKMLEIEGLYISVSVLRRALIEKGLWEKSKNSVEHRNRRDPKEHFGELVQFDGSHHAWFEGRGYRCCLITLIDDATKIRLSQFFEEETMFGAMLVLKMWIERYGIPESLYCDKKNAFVITREPTDSEILKGIFKPKSHFGRACEKLGIDVKAANSPQGKGRVERDHGINQDRLVKELRLAGISTIEEGNKFLLEYYLPKMNSKFTHPPKSGEEAHVPLLRRDNLDDIFCMEFERTVSRDYVVSYNTRLFQILASNKICPRPADKVIVSVRLDYSIHIFWKDRPLKISEITPDFD